MKTTDIHEASYLVCEGHHLENVLIGENRGRRSVFFVFGDYETKESHKKYLEGRAVANVTEMKTCISRLKDCMFNKLREFESGKLNQYYRYSV